MTTESLTLRLALAGVLCAASLAAQSSPPSSATIRRLAPAAFHSLPAPVRRAAEARHCRVPQPNGMKAPSNVIRGAFSASAAHEWAILCSVSDSSRILIYRLERGATARLVDSLRPARDVDWMQRSGGGQWGYSRLIKPMPRRAIRRWRMDVNGHPIPQPIDHDAIEEFFMEKSAEGFYCVHGTWYRQITED